NFFRYMEAAEVDFLQARGLSVAQQGPDGALGFPRVAASCDFLRPARFLDVLDIAVAVQKIGRSSVTYGFEFSCRGEVVARGQVSAACCRILPGHGLEAVAIPPDLRAKLEA